MLPCPRGTASVLQASSEPPGSATIQVYSSDEEVPTAAEESHDNEELAWSQGTTQHVKRGRWKQGVLHVEDERPNNGGQPSSSDEGRGLWKYMSAGQAASHVASPLKRAHAAIEAWSQGSPVLQKCRRLAPDLPGKTVRVLLPCGGIDAPGWAARAMGVEFDVVGYYDTDPQYAAYMANLGVESSRLHVGREQGDFTRLALSHVPQCNLLVAGPPCPPFSRVGTHQGFEDDRTHVFFHIIAVIGHCAATQPGFSGFVLENVAGMMDVHGGKKKHPCRKRPIDFVVHELHKHLGLRAKEWKVQVHQLDAKDFGLPQSRPRVYVTGIRRSRVVDGLHTLRPKQLQLAWSHEPSAGSSNTAPGVGARGMPNLADIMDKSLPPASSHALTDRQKKTILDNKTALQKAMDDPSNRGRVAVCAVSRSGGAKWGVQNRCDGLSGCLSTRNTDLYAFSLGGWGMRTRL